MKTKQELIRAAKSTAPYLVNHMGMSYFERPINCLTPVPRPVTVAEVANAIRSDENLRLATERYRTTRNSNDKTALPHVTPGFICVDRHESSILFPTGIHPIDYDHLPDMRLPHPETGEEVDLVEIIKYEMMREDPYCLLAFRSPSGDGVKAFVWRPIVGNLPPVLAHREIHKSINAAFQKSIGDKYGVKVDEHGDNIAHAAFLAHDDKVLFRCNLENVAV